MKYKLSLLILTLLFLLGCGSTKKLAMEKNNYIGTAKMLDDGTITLNLRAEETNGSAIGHSLFVYKPDNSDYDYIRKHLGNIKKGEVKPVLPFPDK